MTAEADIRRGRMIMRKVTTIMEYDDGTVGLIRLYRHNSIHYEWTADPRRIADQFWASEVARQWVTDPAFFDGLLSQAVIAWLRDDAGHASVFESGGDDLARLMPEVSYRQPLGMRPPGSQGREDEPEVPGE